MTKYRPYSRRELRRAYLRWFKNNTKPFLVLTVGMIALLIVLTFLLTGLGRTRAFNWYALGLLHAAALAGYLHLLHTGFMAHEREAIWHLRGAWGEENTRSELQRAKRKRLIWGWVDSISLQAGDLDHLVVTRHGGLIALDSKWRNNANADDNLDMARAAHKAGLRAQALTRTLLKSARGARHRAAQNPLTVTPAVVLWGPVQHQVPAGASIDGIEFVGGRQLVRWLATHTGQPVSKEAGHDVLERLSSYRASVWQQTTSPRR